jgi:hypothetical protein
MSVLFASPVASQVVVELSHNDVCDEYFETHVQPGLYALMGAAAMLAGA